MKSVWVLYERSDIDRHNEFDYENYETSCRVFDTFEKAGNAMRDLVKSYATEKSSMFDGQGNIVDWPDINIFFDDDFEEGIEDKAHFEQVELLLKKLCLSELNNDDIESITPFYATNYMFDAEFTIDNGISLLMKGVDDGPFNGFDPYIHTNMFDISDENRDYFFYLENQFKCRRDYYSHLFIDLKKVTIE